MTTPSYKTNDPKGWCGDPKRGAALGRDSLHAEDPALFVCTLTVQRVELIDGYDENGTYFGDGDPLFWCASECGEVDFMIRASDRSTAVAKVKAQYPLGTVKPYAADGGVRAIVLRAFARLAWCAAWSDHVEECGCANLSGCDILECAPDAPEAFAAVAESAFEKVEERIGSHKPLAAATAEAIAWFRQFSFTDRDSANDCSDLLTEAEKSPIVGAILVSAKADAIAGQDEQIKEFEEPTNEAWSYLLESDEYAIRFGRCLAYAVAGDGVSWSDDHADIPLPDLHDGGSLRCEAQDLAGNTCEECALPDEIEKMRDEKTGQLPSFSSVGGYTLVYLTKQDHTLCAECAGQLRPHDDKVTDVETYDEGSDLECDGDGCSNVLESSYGDPEEEKRIREAFEASDHYRAQERYQYDRENKEWSVTELGTGRTWSVHYATGGDAIDGLCFEVVADGDGSSAPESEE